MELIKRSEIASEMNQSDKKSMEKLRLVQHTSNKFATILDIIEKANNSNNQYTHN